MASLLNFYEAFKENWILILYNSSKKKKENRERILSISFYKVNTTQITKRDKGITSTDQYLLWIQTQKFLTNYKETKSSNIRKELHDMTK